MEKLKCIIIFFFKVDSLSSFSLSCVAASHCLWMKGCSMIYEREDYCQKLNSEHELLHNCVYQMFIIVLELATRISFHRQL